MPSDDAVVAPARERKPEPSSLRWFDVEWDGNAVMIPNSDQKGKRRFRRRKPPGVLPRFSQPSGATRLPFGVRRVDRRPTRGSCLPGAGPAARGAKSTRSYMDRMDRSAKSPRRSRNEANSGTSVHSVHTCGGRNHREYRVKAEARRRRSMREVMGAACRLSDRLTELSAQTPSGMFMANGWAWRLGDGA